MKKTGPKAYNENVRFTDPKFGNVARADYTRTITKDAPVFPEPLEYDDIDKAFFDFVDKRIPLSIDGREVPTFTLYSSQRFSEYSQTWQHTDADNNLLMNFKTVNRDNNPKSGDHQGGNWNIPGDRRYTLLIRDVLEDDGTESYEVYSMKQPFAADLTYNVNFVTNLLENVNRFNLILNDLFKARQCYIRPNGHFVPMTLEDLKDGSQYSIDDRKFYLQTATIKAMAYIIDKSSFHIEKRPKKINVAFDPDDLARKKRKGASVDIDEYGELEHRTIDLTVRFDTYQDKVEFTIDTDMVVEGIETENVRTLRISVDKTPIYYEKGFRLKNGDDVRVRVVPLLYNEESVVYFTGYNPNVEFDPDYVPENVSEEPERFEDITVE
ncbi:MAG: hypothetical protein LUD72_04540 [Bacteroidales bacterium]|nr:hypothetical protein [Bacteroidales bacterium]